MAAEEGKVDPMKQFTIEPILGSDWQLADGLSIAFTNSALWMALTAILVTVFVAGGMKRELVPGRWQMAVETMTGFIDDLLEANVGTAGRKYVPYIFTLFMFILFGNLLALLQNNLKRLLGYSSIAHFGYLLVALIASKGLAVEAVGVYLATYVLTSLGAFGVITLMSTPYSGRDADALYEYRGLFWRRPYLTAVLTVMMLSLAGIPLTAGFIGKFYVVAAGVQSQQWWLLAALVIGSAIGVFYYLRVMVTLFMVEPNLRRHDAPLHWGQQAGGVMLLFVALLAFFLGVYPQPLLELVQQASLVALLP